MMVITKAEAKTRVRISQPFNKIKMVKTPIATSTIVKVSMSLNRLFRSGHLPMVRLTQNSLLNQIQNKTLWKSSIALTFSLIPPGTIGSKSIGGPLS